MKIVFTGDIAIPSVSDIPKFCFPKELEQAYWFGNLEGAIVEDGDIKDLKLSSKQVIFNSKEAIEKLISDINFKGFLLANNHIFDVPNSINQTDKVLKSHNIPFTGLDDFNDEITKGLWIKEKNENLLILNYGWQHIGCKKASKNTNGTNQLRRSQIVKDLNHYSVDEDLIIIIIFHLNYEFEPVLQPAHRQLCRELIDLGANSIICHHPHVVGPIEVYNKSIIAHTLGNFMFPHKVFWNGNHKYPDKCNRQKIIVFEDISDLTRISTYNLYYSPELNKIKIINKEKILLGTPNTIGKMNYLEYLKYFLAKCTKRIYLPIVISNNPFIGSLYWYYLIVLHRAVLFTKKFK